MKIWCQFICLSILQIRGNEYLNNHVGNSESTLNSMRPFSQNYPWLHCIGVNQILASLTLFAEQQAHGTQSVSSQENKVKTRN